MMTPDEIEKLIPTETAQSRSPIPTQAISSDEFMPGVQTPKQKELEIRLKEIDTRLAKRQGVSRRRFFLEGFVRSLEAVGKAACNPALVGDKVALSKLSYDKFGDGRTNLRYGYMQV